MIRQRRPAAEPTVSTPVPASKKGPSPVAKMRSSESQTEEREPLLQRSLDDGVEEELTTTSSTMRYIRQNRWMVLAIASGACAAFNGVFAKLYGLILNMPWKGCLHAHVTN